MTVIPKHTTSQEVDEWIARSREGDRTAFRALYALHFAQIHRMARYLGTPPPELDDVTQEVFVSAYSKLHQFDEGNFAHWLHRICASIVTSRHRKRQVREAFRHLFSAQPEEEADPGPTPDQHSERREASHQVAAILSRMRPKHREVFALFELEGLSGEEISERVGCPVNTVWTRLHHARRQFVKIGRKRGWVEPSEDAK